MASQFVLKTSQDIEVFHGYPDFKQQNTDANDGQTLASLISPCGRFLAFSTKTDLTVFTGDILETQLFKIPLVDVYDLHFSPSGNYLSTWERTSINNPDHKNVKIWYLNENFDPTTNAIEPVFEYQAKSQSGWSLQFSKLDDYAIKQFKGELRIVKIDHQHKKFDFTNPFAILKQESDSQFFSTYLISPSEHPTICTFTPEKGGKPALLTIWPILEGKITKKIATKTFFKADSCQLKWNPQGNAILCLAITDFDSSNQSYYGENTLYLLSFQGVNGTLGGNSVRVSLTKGPIHDFTWSPTSRQFGVISGYMPATIAFFDLRGNIVHQLPEQPKNTMLFSPTGRYILIGGFGNLQGSVEILDRHDKFKCITRFNATNTSVCKWSPGGEFIMTATTSPRLRVDNGIKVWHVSGKLIFVKEFKELLKVDWRFPCNFKMVPGSHIIKDWEPISKSHDEPLVADPKIGKDVKLQIHSSVEDFTSKNPSAAAIGSKANATKKAGGAYKPPHARRSAGNGTTKSIPGLVPGMSPNDKANGNNTNKTRRRRTKMNENGTTSDGNSKVEVTNNNNTVASPEEKKMRSLLKKLRSIQALKQRVIDGDKLEDTQLLKIKTEEQVIKDLSNLGWKGEE
ncbi:translation initiation factor 2A NDAI_0J01910 [Naumovozyma dairenensis CBS 421]|uniref:Eukaryotic translation initiation factor 2A n=1 Tax=Naumovozyma dairenensis (strain ATCC 10597 / BCRC 20456 / CBS 421 / NBRC 0211 / NRRL Y-12639) TaxID=1071378 RepID=G0WH05_NAUDC|nr:hypothetical protein NDAI_0J01910 [Naumovozyma dairenensis CBS 421]CCD27083.1 hypothetical protein NDAI_0J01910 [Naumovozyma dairenensis CBS 421]